MSQYPYFHTTYHGRYLLLLTYSTYPHVLPTYLFPTYDYLSLESTHGNFDLRNRPRRESNPQLREPNWPARWPVRYVLSQLGMLKACVWKCYICPGTDNWQIVMTKLSSK